MMSSTRIGFAITLALVLSGIAHAVPIYGGLTYDPTTQTGYNGASQNYGMGSPAGNGMAVGYAYKYDSGDVIGGGAMRWGASSAASELGNLGISSSGYTHSSAFAINVNGTAVGSSVKYESGSHKGERAVRWDPSSTVAIELGNLGTNSVGYTESRADAMNASGTAVGWARRNVSGVNKGNRAVRWNALGTEATALGHLGTDNNGVTRSQASAINDAGTIVGFAKKYDESGNYHGFSAVRWDASGTVASELGYIGPNYSSSSDFLMAPTPSTPQAQR